MKNQPPLSGNYAKQLKKSVVSFSRKIIKNGDKDYIRKKYSLFFPATGLHYAEGHELLVYETAASAKAKKWTVKQVAGNGSKIVKKSSKRREVKKGKCQLQWVNDGWVKKGISSSFFWNVTSKLVKHCYNISDNWTHIIAWSSLMKIVPAKGGKPDETECKAQMVSAAKLFREELSELKPKNVLLITSLTWAEPVLNKLGITIEKLKGTYAEGRCSFNESNIIITRAPFIGRHQPFVDEISALLVK